jgi:hypothetical protein
MFWAPLWGRPIWSDFPDALGWAGIAIIGTGLVVMRAPGSAPVEREKAAPEGAA